MAHVLVGEEKASFFVHQEILCSASPFLKAALTGNFMEGNGEPLSLPEDDPDTFERFLQYVYISSYNLSTYATDNLKACQRQAWEYVRLFVFAEKAQVEPLKRQIVKSLFELEREKQIKYPASYTCMEFAYDHTPSGSPLRKVLAASYVWHTSALQPDLLARNPDLAADIAVGMQRRVHSTSMQNPFDGSYDTFSSTTTPEQPTTEPTPALRSSLFSYSAQSELAHISQIQSSLGIR